ncbi:MAG: 4Fe-4S binding protein [Clostridia bacterium]|nr:4Fe-4S binding protein [Clostridia bacterium]
MAYKITEKCLECGKCMSECPMGAISNESGKYVINPDVCISCGVCFSTCENEAIEEE